MASGFKITSVNVFSSGMSILRQDFFALLENTSALVKFICLVMLCGYFLSYFEKIVSLFSVTPGSPVVSWIWTSFTFCFLEFHFWEVCIDVVTLGLCGKLIEPLWGTLEMIIFFVLVNFGVAIISALCYLILYICTLNTDYLFSVHIHGLAGYVAGISVAVKQIMPNYLLVRTPLGKITNRNIPLSLFLMSLILWFGKLLEGTYPTMFMSGLIVSWTYLRFFQRHSNGMIGDLADNFCFANFFPDVCQAPLTPVCNTVYACLVRFGLYRRIPPKYDIHAPSGIIINIPGVDTYDKERRKQIALKALSERLRKVEQLPTASHSSWEPEENKASVHQCVTLPVSTDDKASNVSSATSSTSSPSPDLTVDNELTEL